MQVLWILFSTLLFHAVPGLWSLHLLFNMLAKGTPKEHQVLSMLDFKNVQRGLHAFF